MADINKDRFMERLDGIKQKSDPRKRVVQQTRADGLVVDVLKPRRKKLFPVKSLLTMALIFVMLKGLVYVQIGEAEYTARIDNLKDGTAIEVVAAFLLDAYPMTVVMADGITAIFGSRP